MASLKAGEVEEHLIADGFEVPDGLAAVAVHEDFKQSGEAGLVILAMGDAYWTLMHGSLYVLCVARERADAVRAELEACALLESKRVLEFQTRYREFRFGLGSFIIYTLLLAAIFWLQPRYGLIDLGRVDSLAIWDAGQWWRCVTALTLHSDIVHLVSNVVAGMGFAFFVARFLGAVGAWGLILLSGLLGNLLNAWVSHPVAHFSIGASTAVFGALGILTGVGICVALVEPEQRWTLPRWLLPVLGGLTLLGMLGVGDGLVDVAAHISGFLCGVVLGIVGTLCQPAFVAIERFRYSFAVVLYTVIAGAWWLAFSAA